MSHDAFSINLMWVLLAGCLVMFMQVGFALVETGLCRAKNAAHTMSMNLMVYPLGTLAFWAFGFAIGWGNYANVPAVPAAISSLGPGTAVLNSGWGIGAEPDAAGHSTGKYRYGLIGLKGFFLKGLEDPGVLALFFFMTMFLDTMATIPTGALAERWAWKNFTLYSVWIVLPYCLFAHWLWGGGFLAQAGKNWGLGHGAVDFAGSGVVHGMGGLISLAGLFVLGPRLGKYVRGRPQPLPGHHVPMTIIGTFILAFGWFGFNAGSTLAGTDVRISLVMTNTLLASVAGSVAAMLTMYSKRMKPDPTLMGNGMLAGLVAITAGCAYVDTWAAVIIGGVAGALVVQGVLFFEQYRIDDPVGAISVHGVSGFWGLLAVGLFANGTYGQGLNGVVREAFLTKYGADGVRGLFFGDSSQFLAQLLDCGVLLAFGLVAGWIGFQISSLITPMRVSPETEIEGLDTPEMGALGYPDFAIVKRG